MGEKTNSLLFMVRYNGNMYTYLKNLQGDIVGIVDSNGNLVVEYRYDAWGKPLSKTGSLASTLGTLNPFRYRGYVYDEETGLYYLGERYYDAVKCRFFNADSVILSNADLWDAKLYAYCANNPIRYVDENGNGFWDKLKKAAKAVATAVAIATVVVAVVVVTAAVIGSGFGPTLAIAGAEAAASVTVSKAIVAGTAVVAGAIIHYASKGYEGRSKYNKNGKRVDYEYNGNGTGNVHIHVDNVKYTIWSFAKNRGMYYTLPRFIKKSLRKLK